MQQLIVIQRIEMREFPNGRVTTSRALEPDSRLFDDVVEFGQNSGRELLGLIEIRRPERPREVLPFSDDRDQELRHRLPDAPIVVPHLEVQGLSLHGTHSFSQRTERDPKIASRIVPRIVSENPQSH
jgi:hypothetical protein